MIDLVCEWCKERFPPPDWKPYPRFCSKKCRHEYAGQKRRGTKGYVKTGNHYRHRLIAQQKLGRPLRKEEIVAFEDGDRSNLDPGNLLIFDCRGDFNAYRSKRRKRR